MSVPVFDVDYPLTITRRIAWDTPLDCTVADAEVVVRGRIYQAGGVKADRSDVAPRSYLPRSKLWYKPGAVDPDLSAGERVRDATGTYEVLTPAIGKRAGTTILIVEVEVALLAGLYPQTVELQELGGELVQEMPAAVWHESDVDTDKGELEHLVAEAPVEFFAPLSTPNRQLSLNGRVFHIARAVLHHDQPHVSMELRLGTIV